MPWYTHFDRPIAINGGPALKTLAEARGYIHELPQDVRDSVEWMAAEAMLSEAAVKGGPYILIAQHALVRALLRRNGSTGLN